MAEKIYAVPHRSAQLNKGWSQMKLKQWVYIHTSSELNEYASLNQWYPWATPREVLIEWKLIATVDVTGAVITSEERQQQDYHYEMWGKHLLQSQPAHTWMFSTWWNVAQCIKIKLCEELQMCAVLISEL